MKSCQRPSRRVDRYCTCWAPFYKSYPLPTHGDRPSTCEKNPSEAADHPPLFVHQVSLTKCICRAGEDKTILFTPMRTCRGCSSPPCVRPCLDPRQQVPRKKNTALCVACIPRRPSSGGRSGWLGDVGVPERGSRGALRRRELRGGRAQPASRRRGKAANAHAAAAAGQRRGFREGRRRKRRLFVVGGEYANGEDGVSRLRFLRVRCRKSAFERISEHAPCPCCL